MHIYLITNLINLKCYVGLTRKSDVTKRFKAHKSNYRSNRKGILYEAMRKYGIENFKFESIDSASSIDELKNKEIYWISRINSLSPNGYNLLQGGDLSETHIETRQKLSKILKSKNRKLLPKTKEAFDIQRAKQRIEYYAVNRETGKTTIFYNLAEAESYGFNKKGIGNALGENHRKRYYAGYFWYRQHELPAPQGVQ